MSHLTPEIIDLVIAACRAGVADTADALGRALGGRFTLGEAAQGAFAADAAPAGFDGPGLVVLLTIGGSGFAIVLPESSGLLPPWYAAPDATGDSKLSTLAQELSMLVVPETLVADKFEAHRVASIADALRSGATASDAAHVAVKVTGAERKRRRTEHRLAPGVAGRRLESATDEKQLAAPAAQSAATPAPAATPSPAGAALPLKPLRSAGCHTTPAACSRFKLPVSVHLATKKESVQEVVELVPGAIIKFEKGCDELLHMVVGGQTVAEGEAVKIGDKFGFRVTAHVAAARALRAEPRRAEGGLSSAQRRWSLRGFGGRSARPTATSWSRTARLGRNDEPVAFLLDGAIELFDQARAVELVFDEPAHAVAQFVNDRPAGVAHAAEVELVELRAERRSRWGRGRSRRPGRRFADSMRNSPWMASRTCMSPSSFQGDQCARRTRRLWREPKRRSSRRPCT